MTKFLKEAFDEVPFASSEPASFEVSDVEYDDVDGTMLKSYLATPSDDWVRPLPAVVIVP